MEEERKASGFQELVVKAVSAGEADNAVVDERLLEEATTSLESRDPPQLPLGIFVLSVSLRTHFRRLHVTGACPPRTRRALQTL